MNLTCPKGCERSVARYANGIVAFAGANVFGYPEQKQASPVAVPPAMLTDFGEMIQLTGLRHEPPTIEFFDNLHGVGGMFIPDQWAILVGMQDQRAIASEVIARWPTQLANIFARSKGGRMPTESQLFKFTWEAAIRRCMAHEIGHALLASGSTNPYAPDDEAGADYYAGKLDAARGRSRELGMMFFYSIGCVGPSCHHPDPPTRVAAYAAGYDAQRRAA